VHLQNNACTFLRFHLLRERFQEAQKNGLHRDMSSRVQCVISQIAGLLQDHQARLKNPKASQLTLEPYSRILPQRISAARQQCAMVSKEKWRLLWTWSWELLILERTAPWHCLWCQLQCICHQVYRFLNLSPSVWWHKNAQVRATFPTICDVWQATNRHLLIYTQLGKQEHQCLQSTGAR
jgi:hypothetical protein